eukprot:scaffold104563_cov60-Phaeocystis_antarctica.AAC.1
MPVDTSGVPSIFFTSNGLCTQPGLIQPGSSYACVPVPTPPPAPVEECDVSCPQQKTLPLFLTTHT